MPAYNIFGTFFLVIFCTVSSEKTIQTSTGSIRGISLATENSNVDVFLGIPYAEPPTGELRFAKPVPKKPWEGIYNAIEKPAPCCQNVTKNFYWEPNIENMSEDCLYLNIWVPKVDTNKMPKPMTVMVWIHGGAFNLGYSLVDITDGAKLAAYGEVIVVTINYRIGALGFLSALIEEANGNMGIFDQIVALRWIKENIANFGGDPESITLFGESAGSMSVTLHLLSPLSQGLFKRAILQSGTALGPQASKSNDFHIRLANHFASMVGCTNSSYNITTHPQPVVKCLKRVPAEKLTSAEGKMMSTFPITFYPRYDEEYLPFEVKESLQKFHYKNTELLIGNNQDEGALFLIASIPQYFGVYGWNGTGRVNKGLARSLIQTIFQYLDEKDISKIRDAYVKNEKMKVNDDLRKAIYYALGDYLITCTSVLFADFYSRNNTNIYYYVFNYKSNSSVLADWLGVTHYEEIQYVFGNPLTENGFTDPEKLLSYRMMDRWISFAKTGNPNINDAVNWPSYSYDNPLYLNIDIQEEIKKYPTEDRCEFWKKRYKYLL